MLKKNETVRVGRQTDFAEDNSQLPMGVRLLKGFFVGILRLLFRVEVKGLENYKKAGVPAVIVVNHVSFLDGMLVGAFLPGKPLFAINTQVANQWWVRLFTNLVDVYALDPANPMAIKSLIRQIQDTGQNCVIFPEGRITVTGALMKIYEGPGMVADKVSAPVLPVRIDGAQYSYASRLKGKVRLRLFPKITMTIQPPVMLEVDKEIKGRRRRQEIGLQLYDVMSDMIFETCNYKTTLFDALTDACKVNGGNALVVEDVNRDPLSYNRLLVGANVLGHKFAEFTEPKEKVGVLLPNSVGVAVTFFGLQAVGRVPAMLNFSTGVKNMRAALKGAQIKTVLTSRLFIEKGKLEHLIEGIRDKVKIVYLEDIKEKVYLEDKLRGLFWGRFFRSYPYLNDIHHDDPAVVLFTSGSEGTPKGVVLSHSNLLANRYQLAARIDFNPSDIVFNALPVFHSFGLTGGMLLPMLSGIKTFLYPSPLHYRIVPAMVYDTDATIMFGTDTFLRGYARVANVYDFYAVRYVFAGAEKVKAETRMDWMNKFGLRIMEGYGATETSPGITINTPMHYRAGTVGRLLPGISHELVPVPGIDGGGKLEVSGPNVMLGYLRAENPGVLEAPKDGIYDTGDIVSLDEDGFVSIKGRVKRFAKIAGEMVSLGAAEQLAGKCWPEASHAVISVPDARKGEMLILATTQEGAERKALSSFAKGEGIAELMVPRDVRVMDKIPVLGTGKTDYVTLKEMLEE